MMPQIQSRLYFDMLRIRTVEEHIAAVYAEQEMRCPVHLCTGQEAIAVGVSASLERKDMVLGNHRSHGHYLAKGGDLDSMMAEIYGREGGCANGNGGSMHLIDLGVGFLGSTPIVASSIPIAVGAAFTAKMKKTDAISVVYFGDGATEAGVFHESVNFAATQNLPIVFVCEDNLYSVYSPLDERQSSQRDVLKLVEGGGVYSAKGNGNDVEEVYHLSKTAIERTRSGAGPSFLKFSTYRWREHCGPNFDNDIGYRSEAEFLEWQAHCPIAKYGAYLIELGLMTENQSNEFKKKFEQEIAHSINYAKQQPFPSEKSAYLESYSG